MKQACYKIIWVASKTVRKYHLQEGNMWWNKLHMFCIFDVRCCKAQLVNFLSLCFFHTNFYSFFYEIIFICQYFFIEDLYFSSRLFFFYSSFFHLFPFLPCLFLFFLRSILDSIKNFLSHFQNFTSLLHSSFTGTVVLT